MISKIGTKFSKLYLRGNILKVFVSNEFPNHSKKRNTSPKYVPIHVTMYLTERKKCKKNYLYQN